MEARREDERALQIENCRRRTRFAVLVNASVNTAQWAMQIHAEALHIYFFGHG